jgi:hypothetical protein
VQNYLLIPAERIPVTPLCMLVTLTAVWTYMFGGPYPNEHDFKEYLKGLVTQPGILLPSHLIEKQLELDLL